MESSRLSLKRALLLTAFFAAGVLAQDDDEDETSQNPPAQTSTRPAETTPTPTPRPTPTSSESSAETEESSSSSSSPSPRPTLPGLSTSSTTQSILSNMPTVSRGVIPTHPPPGIPPTRNAPFMNHSTLPEGTVFIAVGAIIGAFLLAVLAWRAIVSCLLHRSVERAAIAQHAANNAGVRGGDKAAAAFPAPPAQFYKYIERESSASLAGAGIGGSTGRRTHRGPTPSATPSQTNLFFSPTAAGSSSGLAGGSNRDSARFLPSGFYASASPVPGQAGSHPGHGNSISMNTLRPSSRGRGAGLGPSPPESPDVGPRVVSRNFSTSSLNLNRPPSPGARAPSAYLDDLLDEQPGMFPPAGGSPSPQGHRGRY
ncbi:hypothetical protein MFIFM68171_05244 [Madurella fahalii]|uniref:Uncharacterized protein n=1 Tax=Madurella fahalii TaxID=1157608 RepID=A0ABQ0GBD0_9PEZI